LFLNETVDKRAERLKNPFFFAWIVFFLRFLKIYNGAKEFTIYEEINTDRAKFTQT